MFQGRRFGTNHQATERRIGLIPRIAHPCDLTPAKHRTCRAELSDFMQFVTDVQQAATFTDQLFQNDKQFLYRLRC